jgi:hypothetical protein
MIVTRHEITEVQSPCHALLTKCWPASPKRVRFRGEISTGGKGGKNFSRIHIKI